MLHTFLKPARAATPNITPGDFSSLKSAIEDPNRDETVVVPGGTYTISAQISVSENLILKNEAGKTVSFVGDLATMASTVQSMFNVQGASLTIDGETNDSIVFDGGNGGIASELANDPYAFSDKFINDKAAQHTLFFRSDTGVFINASGEASSVTINHGSFKNATALGLGSAPIVIKNGAQAQLNDGNITNNVWIFSNTADLSHIGSAGIASIGGELSIQGGSISANYAMMYGVAAISSVGNCNQRAKLTISGGNISNNHGSFKINDDSQVDKHSSSAGYGSVYVGPKTDAVVNGGTFDSNFVEGWGAALFQDYGSSLVVNGGSFTNNYATLHGGAISVTDRFVVGDNGGNTSSDLYENSYNNQGITDYNEWKRRGFDSKFVVNGGTFKNNSSWIGGAINVSTNDAEINGGIFDSNKATRFGGAIYLTTYPYKMTIRNAYIANDRADASASTDSVQIFSEMVDSMPKGAGGGVWYCPTGSGTFAVSNGAIMVGNNSTLEGADFSSVKTPDVDTFSASLSHRVLGGALVEYHSDSKQDRASGSSTLVDDLNKRSVETHLVASVSDRGIETAKKFAKTIFTNNVARRGGAIATNGEVDFGDSQQEFKLKVVKAFGANVTVKKPVHIQLFAEADGTDQLVQEAELNQDNDFTYNFENLPLYLGGSSSGTGYVTYRVKELETGYVTSYTVTLPNQKAQTGDSFDTKQLVHGDTVVVGVTNDEPEKPKTDSFSLRVNKVFGDAIRERPDIHAYVKAELGNTVLYNQTLTLNSSNNYEVTLDNIPIKMGEGNQADFVQVTVEEIETGYVTHYGVALPGQEAAEGNSFNTQNIHDGDVVNITITNDKAPTVEKKQAVLPKTGDIFGGLAYVGFVAAGAMLISLYMKNQRAKMNK